MGEALLVRRGGGVSNVVNSIIEEYLAQTGSINANTFVEFCGSTIQLNSTDITNNPTTNTFRAISCYAIAINETYAVLLLSNRDYDANYTYGYAISIKLTDNTVSVVTTIKINNYGFDEVNWTEICGAKVEDTNYIVATTHSRGTYSVILLLFSIDYSTGVLSYVSKTNVSAMGNVGDDSKITALGQGNFLLSSIANCNSTNVRCDYVVFSVSSTGVVTIKQNTSYPIKWYVAGQFPNNNGVIGVVSPSKVILASATKLSDNLISAYVSVYNIADNGTITEDISTRIPLIPNNENIASRLYSSTEIVKEKEFLVSIQLETFKQSGTTEGTTALWGFMRILYDNSSQKLVISKISCLNYYVNRNTIGDVQKINEHRFIGFFGNPLDKTKYVVSNSIYLFEIYVSNSGIHFSEPVLLENIYDEYSHKVSHPYCLCGNKLLYISQATKNSDGGATSGKCIITLLQPSPTQIKPSEVAIDGLLQSTATTTKAGKVALLKGVE